MPEPIHVYLVEDTDYIAAKNPDEALAFYREMYGDTVGALPEAALASGHTFWEDPYNRDDSEHRLMIEEAERMMDGYRVEEPREKTPFLVAHHINVL